MRRDAAKVDVVMVAGVGGEPVLTTLTSLVQQTETRWTLHALTPDPTQLARALEGPTAPKGVSRDPRLVMIEFAGSSRAAAWNRALRDATGAYLMVLEPGDTLEPHALRTLLDAADRSKLGGAVGGFAMADDEGKPTGYQRLPGAEMVGLGELYRGEPAPGSVSIVGMDRVGTGSGPARFGAGLPDFVRLDFALRLADSGRSWAAVHEVLGTLRVRHDRATRDFSASAETAEAIVRRSFRRASAAGFEAAGMELSDTLERDAVVRRTFAVATLAAVVDPEPRKTKATEILRHHLGVAGPGSGSDGSSEHSTARGGGLGLMPQRTASSKDANPGLSAEIGADAAVWAVFEQMGYRLDQSGAWAAALGHCWQRVVGEKRAARGFLDDAWAALADRLASPGAIAHTLVKNAGGGQGPVIVAGGSARHLARLVADTASRAGRSVTLMLPEKPPAWAVLGGGSGGVVFEKLGDSGPAGSAGASLIVVSEDRDEERALLGRFGPRPDVHRWLSVASALSREIATKVSRGSSGAAGAALR